MKKYLIILIALCAITAQAQVYGNVQCNLIKVIDGDTIKCDIPDYPPIIGKDISIRFRGINTPEIHGAEAEKGYISKAKLEAIMSKAHTVMLHDIGRDKYFRIDADIYVDGEKINTPEKLYP